MEEPSSSSYSESQTTHKEVSQLSQISIHFDKEEVKFLYFNLNCNFLKCNELLSNVPNEKIKKCIEDLESRRVTKSQFAASLNKLIADKLDEDERLKKRVRLTIDFSQWKAQRSSSPVLCRLTTHNFQTVCQFLDLYSLYALSLTEKYFFKVEKLSPFYKVLSSIAFKQLPQADESVYSGLLEIVKKSSFDQMPAERKQKVLQDVRRFVWQKDPKQIKTTKKYFGEAVNNFREMFFRFPHLRFDGFYCCTETYFRKGMADMTGFYVPIHYVKSYRYLRYFDSGHVLYCISTKHFSLETALKLLTRDYYEKSYLQRRENQPTMMFGEFILSNGSVSIKMPDKAWINEMEHVMHAGEGFDDNHLQIVHHVMRDIETGAVHQMEHDMKQKERYYYFSPVPQFLADISCSQTRAMLTFRHPDAQMAE